MQQYIFYGSVYPMVLKFGLTQSLLLPIVADGKEIKCRISVHENKFVVSTEVEKPNIWALMNTVRALMRTLVDAKGFVDAVGWDVLLDFALMPNGEIVPFHGAIPELHKERGKRAISAEQVVGLALEHPHLRRALESLREAIRVPLDRAFHCFRAIECIRLHFKEEEDEDSRLPSWRRMSEALRVDRSWTSLIERPAKEQRHGETVDLEGHLSVAILGRTYRVTDRFCAFLMMEETALSEDKFPLLQE